jgi:ribulose-5-phosphate 4-epimerase/fuculose-1-phosphate aldolase
MYFKRKVRFKLNRDHMHTPEILQQIETLVVANRILYDQGIVDGLGHVSVRVTGDSTKFLLSCNRAPALVVRSDIVCYDMNGDAVSLTSEKPYLERFIHSEIYRARPDVFAVVHSHSPSVIPFGVTNHRLRPIFHMAGFLGSGTAHFEIRDALPNQPETDMLIRNAALGEALAKSLGSCSCVLMRGHGSTTVGASVEQVVYRAIYAEINAKLQLQSLGLGDVTYLTETEAQLAAQANDGQIARSWNLWRKRIDPEGIL